MKVLIADDHELIRRGLCHTLNQLLPGCEILEAATADQVLELVETNPDLELVLLDLFMPGKAGFVLVGRLCDDYPDITLVVLSASDQPEHISKAIDLGAAGYIPKAAGNKVMSQALGLVLAGGIYIPPQMLGRSEPSQAVPVSVPEPSSLPEGLTERQLDVLRCLARGLSNREIAEELGLSLNTVKIHVAAILRTLDVENRTQAAILGQGLWPVSGGGSRSK